MPALVRGRVTPVQALLNAVAANAGRTSVRIEKFLKVFMIIALEGFGFQRRNCAALDRLTTLAGALVKNTRGIT
jgi:hypothetical protein